MIDVTPLIGSHDPVGEERLPVEDPATGERIGRSWSATRGTSIGPSARHGRRPRGRASVHERAAVRTLADVIESNLDELARIESRDQASRSRSPAISDPEGRREPALSRTRSGRTGVSSSTSAGRG